jgi:hypothetical protein
MSNKKIVGVIYNFYPVQTDEGEEDFEAIDEAWQWKFFGWWFEIYTAIRAIIADLMGYEIPFIIKVKDNGQEEK